MATRAALFPSCNRNLPRIIDNNGFGLIAYGVRSCIYVFDLTSSPPLVLDSMVFRNGHQAKVLSVSFCKCKGNDLLASLGEERVLKIWDLMSSSCIASLEVKEVSRDVEWLYGSPNSVVYSDTFGFVNKWNFRSHKVVRMKTKSDSRVSVLSSNKNCPELLAVGHVTGSISVLNVNSHTELYKLLTHSEEVTSLSWSPVSSCVLLSVSTDHSARLWKLGENKPIKTYYYPSSRNKIDDKRRTKPFGICHPENADMIICSNVRGEMGSITLKESEHPKFQSYIHKDYDPSFRTIFFLSSFFIENDDRKMVLSVDLNKCALWDVSNQKLLSSYYFNSGNLNELTVSSNLRNWVAICPGDGFLKIWNAASDAAKVEVTNILINYRTKILCAAWHPIEECLIAYGTDEGRVGIADIDRKRSLYSYETHHSSTVYNLQWAPCSKINDSQGEYFLYSCGAGVIYIHELHKYKGKAVEFDSIITLPPDFDSERRKCTEFCWKSDYTCLAVGTGKGYIQLFDDKLCLMAYFSIQIKNIENLKWHPMYTFASPNGSNYNSWLSVVGNDDNIHIFDAAKISKGNSEPVLCQSTRVLTGHKKRVCSVCWSPHNDGFLASAGRDGTVRIWNAVTVTCIAIYPYHRDLVYAVQWSYFDSDVIYSGGLDNCLRIWKISEYSECTPPTEKVSVAQRKRLKPKRDTRNGHATSPKEVSVPEKNDKDAVKESEKANFITETAEENQGSILGNVNMTKVRKTLFPEIYNKCIKGEESVCDIFKLVDMLSERTDSDSIVDKISEEDVLKYGFYCDQLTALKMLDNLARAAKFVERGQVMQLMAVNIESVLNSAAEKKNLTEFLVSCAPRVSVTFWNQMCEKYAIQLVEENQFIKASLYFSLCGKLHDAINTLLEKERVFEALALAKAHLPESDPALRHVLYKTANYLSFKRMPASEASCYLAMKEPLQAAKILYANGSSEYMYASTYICHKFNLQEAESYGYFCMEKCLSGHNFSTLYKIFDIIDSLKVYKMLVRVHELISSQLKTFKKEEMPKLFGVIGNKPPIWEGKIVDTTNPIFLAHICDILKRENILPEDNETLQEIYKAIESFYSKREKREIDSELHVTVATCATLTILASFLDNHSLATKYFMKMFSTGCKVAYMPRVIFWLFIPLNLYWYCNGDEIICESNIQDTEYTTQSFMTHFQFLFTFVSTKFISIGKLESQDCILQNISSNLNSNVQQVLAILSKKTTGDNLVIYFAFHYLNELRRQAKQGWKFRCYNTAACNESQKEVHKDIKSGMHSGSIDFTISYNRSTNGVSIESEGTRAAVIDPISYATIDKLGKIDASAPAVTDVVEKTSTFVDNGIENGEIEASATAVADVVGKNLTLIDNGIEDEEIEASAPAVTDVVEKTSTFVDNGIENGEIEASATAVADAVEKKLTLIDNGIEDEEIEASAPAITDVVEKNSIYVDNDMDELRETEVSALAVTDVVEKNSLSVDNDVDILRETEVSALAVTDVIEKNSTSVDNGIEMSENYLAVEHTHENNMCVEEFVGKTNESKADTRDIKKENHGKDKNSILAGLENIDEITALNSDDDHAECWTDVSLYYVVVKYFMSIICRDEYALLFYLKKCLTHLDLAIADLTRQKQSTKSLSRSNGILVEEKCDEGASVSKCISSGKNIAIENDTLSLDRDSVQEEVITVDRSKIPSGDIVSDKSLMSEIEDKPDALSTEEDIILMSTNVTEEIETGAKDIVNDICKELDQKNVCDENLILTGSVGQEINIDCKNVEKLKAGISEKIDSDQVMIKIIDKLVGQTGESKVTDVTDIEGPMQENGDASISSSNIEMSRTQNIVFESLLAEHEEISEQIQLLRSEEFTYPNPFDAVSAVDGICCDIFQKNPCRLVKEKFHELSHEVKRWSCKYSAKEHTVICTICQATISA